MAWLRSACVVSGVLVLASACREQPEGVVLLVQGVDKAEELWLTVGTDRKVIQGPRGAAAEIESNRFSQSSALSRFYMKEKPFKDGDEVFLDRPELMAQDEIAIVLDASVKEGGGNNINILRSAYAFDLESGMLNEVKVNPSQIGPGQWVCAGKPSQDGEKSFAVVASQVEKDCDRDGWDVDSDPDDADPLTTGTMKWMSDPDNVNLCRVFVGNRRLRFLASRCLSDCSRAPTDYVEFEGCLDGQAAMRCKVGTRAGRIEVSKLVPATPSNPDWELARLGPAGFNVVFAPSFRSPNEWSVQFAITGVESTAYFVLNDRAAQGASTTVSLEYIEGVSTSCVFDPGTIPPVR